jgi:hypothetical protein
LLGEDRRIAAFRFGAIVLAAASIASECRQHRSIAVGAASKQWDRERLHVAGSGSELPQMIGHRCFLMRGQERRGKKYVGNASVEQFDSFCRRRRPEQFRAKVCTRHGAQLRCPAAIRFDGKND